MNMSVNQYQKVVNDLDKEIIKLEEKRVVIESDIAKKRERITSIQNSINKNTSQSILNTKLRQIKSLEADITKKTKESVELSSKMANKRKRLVEANKKLQKEQQLEQKHLETENKKVIDEYQGQIRELQQMVSDALSHSRVSSNNNNEEYDVFVSHAWEDKTDFVDEFVIELKNQGLKVWYDKDRMKIGDSMRERIDNGLSKSRYGIVVLSPDYIAESKYWTKEELNGLFQMETINGKMILPIWHKLTKKQVVEYSPIIADRLAMTTADYTPAEIAIKIKELFTNK